MPQPFATAITVLWHLLYTHKKFPRKAKATTTNTQQDLPIKVTNYSQLLVSKALGKDYITMHKSVLIVNFYFHILALAQII
jgi:hypothetical protein